MVRAGRIVVVGGGVVGLATALQLTQARPDLEVTVLEAEADVGLHQSSRNSGVVHAGVYYTPGSEKAQLCVAGRRELEAFCAEHGVPYERRGKVVVAVRRDELPRLRDLAGRARANGVDVEELDAAGVAEHEPHVRALAGLLSPSTGATDFGALCRTYARLVAEQGGHVVTGARVTSIDETATEVRVRSTTGDHIADAVVICGGVQADRLAGLSDQRRAPRTVPFRGSWLRLDPAKAHLVRGNIYPVPQPGLSFLGVHLTRRIDGQVWAGPNAVLALSRHGAQPWSVDLRDLAATLSFPGLWRLGLAHPRVAAGEVFRDLVLAATVREIQRYVPAIEARDLERGPWGVRAQLVTHDGQLVDDFTFHDTRRVVHVLNAPSPAATASLAIGRVLRDRVLARLG